MFLSQPKTCVTQVDWRQLFRRVRKFRLCPRSAGAEGAGGVPGYRGKSHPWSRPESSTRGQGFVESDKLIAVGGSGWMHGAWVRAVGCRKSGTAALGV